jgi:hypothetical protein
MQALMHICLPAPLKSRIDRQVVQHGYSSANEFVCDVLRREQAVSVKARLERHLLESLDSGPARQLERKGWSDIRAKGLAMARRRKRLGGTSDQ